MSVPSDGSVQATFAATLVDEWVRGGVTEAVICPGSRSTPLALALGARPDLRLHVRLDERGAGFYALGLALDSGRPALVCTTSGTAAAELHPAVVEAHHGRVPLLVCTADRPSELQDVGAPQTIDQPGLFGSAVRWQASPGIADPGRAAGWRPLAARALSEAVDGPDGPGPVHLNLAFREPLVARPGPLPPGRPDGDPAFGVLAPDHAPGPAARAAVASWPGRRGVLVAGARCGPPDMVLEVGTRLGWPVLADPRSGCRMERPGVVGAPDAFLRDPATRRALLPEVVVVLGDPWASKALGELVREAAGAGAEVVAVDPWWRVVDPDGVVARRHRSGPEAWLGAVLGLLETGRAADGGAWLRTWTAVELAAQAAIDGVISADATSRGGRLTEPALARHLVRAVPAGTRLFVASSMPVRDLEWFMPPLAAPPPVVANRGANGIDGLVSTALGLAAGGGGPVVGLLGDLAFLHDAGALVDVSAQPRGDPCVLVVVDNGGGGIFSFLPQATEVDPARFELLFGTPPAADPLRVASGYGLPVADGSTLDDVVRALGTFLGSPGPSLVRARVPGRDENVALHDRIHAAVAAAVGPAWRAGPGQR